MFVKSVFVCFVYLQISLSHSQSKNESESEAQSIAYNASSNDQQNSSDSSFIPLVPSIFPDDEATEESDYIHDIDELEAYLGGPLEGRKFVKVSRYRSAGGGKTRHITYKFRTNARVKRDSVRELKKDTKTHPGNLNETILAELQKTPEGFNSNTIYYHYTHQLTAIERIEATNATLGSHCEPKSILDYDYCERAAYPNKRKMVCDGVGTSPSNHTCICKYYRTTDSALVWEQMKTGVITLEDGSEVTACLVPAYGACDHRLPTGIKDLHGNNIYEVDACKGHYQCDNTPYLAHLKKGVTLKVTNHCTQDDFLKQFEPEKGAVDVRDKVLLCAKPHPRRFHDYDEFKYYCLPEKSRDPNQWEFKKPESEEEEKEEDVFFDDED